MAVFLLENFTNLEERLRIAARPNDHDDDVESWPRSFVDLHSRPWRDARPGWPPRAPRLLITVSVNRDLLRCGPKRLCKISGSCSLLHCDSQAAVFLDLAFGFKIRVGHPEPSIVLFLARS